MDQRYLQLRKYIPAGCLGVVAAPSDLGYDADASNQWMLFSDPQDLTNDADTSAELSTLPLAAQEALLKSIRPYDALFRRRWVHFEFGVSRDGQESSILRVYVLPDDVDRRIIDRSDPVLQRLKKDLMARLDFSPRAWEGHSIDTSSPSRPLLLHQDGQTPDKNGADMSLLQMFNSIASPDPHPEVVHNGYAREFMTDLLNSKVPGLTTTLYPYQRRSAALMLQREAQPGQVLDPRLLQVADQHGQPWYYDNVVGTVLREPRHYDDVRGGILAEEMGSGKTLICLALILATRHQPAEVPDIYKGSNVAVRSRVGSLMDMAAATITRNSVPWSLYFDQNRAGGDREYEFCVQAIQRNLGWYDRPRPEARRGTRQPQTELPPTRIYLSRASLVIVPANLLGQWTQEIAKHTEGLKVLVLKTKDKIPPVEDLLTYDIILISIPRFENMWHEDRLPERDGSWRLDSPLGQIHFKRCIVDEGHKLGNAKIGGSKTNILLVLDCLQVSARWIATGTPSQGLYGVDDQTPAALAGKDTKTLADSGAQERKDLERIGSIASLYLRARPWSNTVEENGDTLADWKVYVMQPKHSPRSSGRKDCLRTTFESLIIRHRLSEVGDLLPPVNEKLVYLDGSYQDKIALNLFSMMIILNSVQSQRTDQDYFFHPRQRKNLLQLVHNLRQSSFFGGSFFSADEITKSVETAEKFLEEKKITVSEEDERLLREAIAFGKIAQLNKIREAANMHHEVPVYVRDFPGGLDQAQSWSMRTDDLKEDPVCSNWRLISALQRFLNPWVDSPQGLNTLLNGGRLMDEGNKERDKALSEQLSTGTSADNDHKKHNQTLAGNTKLGEDGVSPRKRHTGLLKASKGAESIPTPPQTPEADIPEPLAKTQIISTASAKLSYLVDSIIKYQDDEQILVFYENENVAWYLAGLLEVLDIKHLIYAKGITVERRAQYVATFNQSTKFRVLLMDISQAAFGLDMRSASRIYFINPVLNPQVEAQAIGRVRRISQKKEVFVETLVLRGSLEEVIMERKQKMTQAEHRKCKSILDDRPIFNWILNVKIIPLPDIDNTDGPAQMAPLKTPQYVFGRGFGRETSHPDEDLVPKEADSLVSSATASPTPNLVKRKFALSFGQRQSSSGLSTPDSMEPPPRRVRFAASEDDDVSPSPALLAEPRVVRFADEPVDD